MPDQSDPAGRADDPDQSVLERILAGDRGPGLAAGLREPTQRAAVAAVPHYLNDVESAAC
ncbi:hypothetical protein ACW4TU_19595 [Streptomyces sp. QTS52]